MLKRQNRRVYLVAFMDDHSRFIVGYGLHASQSSALVIEVARASWTAYGVPEEILTDNGSQYVTKFPEKGLPWKEKPESPPSSSPRGRLKALTRLLAFAS
jgi:transposase InsO family protein